VLRRQRGVAHLGHRAARVSFLSRRSPREGFTRADDTLPKRLMEEPGKAGASKGEVIAKAGLDLMPNEYYTARGWDTATGVPTRGKL
jgi:aldehyde:ferredoxin oxidoreductase